MPESFMVIVSLTAIIDYFDFQAKIGNCHFFYVFLVRILELTETLTLNLNFFAHESMKKSVLP